MKIHTRIDRTVQWELSRKTFVVSLVLLIVGALGIAVSGVFMVLFPDENRMYGLLIACALPFAFGLIFLLSVQKLLKTADNMNTINEYEFFDDYFTVTSFTNGEQMGSSKVYYHMIVKTRQTNLCILLYISKVNAYGILCSEFQKIHAADPTVAQKLFLFIDDPAPN